MLFRMVNIGASGADDLAAADSSAEGGRIVAVVGPDGAGKSKVCAALLELGQPAEKRAPAESSRFAQKGRLLEWESAESRRNFSCYNHFYSQGGEGGSRLHLIDTPGHIDRQPLVDRALHAAHGAVVVVRAAAGSEGAAACSRGFAAVERAAKPAVVFLNGVDEQDDAANFEATLDGLERRLGIRPVVLFAPAHVGGAPTGSRLLNVLDGTLCSPLDCSLVEEGHEGKASGDLAQWASKLRDQQIESLSAVDDELMDAFVEFNGEVPRVMIEAALHRAVRAGKIMPLVAGSAKSGLGIDALQEVARSFIPGNEDQLDIIDQASASPVESVAFSTEAPFLGWAFGDRHTPSGEHLLEVRVLDGTLRPGKRLKALVTSESEDHLEGRIHVFAPSQLLMHGLRGEFERAESVGPGDLVMVSAPNDCASPGVNGFLLSDADRPMTPNDVQDVAAARKLHEARRGPCRYTLDMAKVSGGDASRLLEALQVILQDDDGLVLEQDARTGERQLSFMGKLHVELVRERLAEEFKVLEFPLGRAHVGYRATVRHSATASGSHEKAGKTRLRKGIEHKHAGKVDASVKVEVAPGTRDAGVTVEDPAAEVDPTRGGKVARQAAAGLKKGILTGLGAAGPGGIPVTDVCVRVLGAEAGNDEEALAAAAAEAVRKAVEATADLAVLEPIVHLDVDVPPDVVDDVEEDLHEHRRGEVWGATPSNGEASTVQAEVPLRELQDYAGALEKLTHGEGYYTYRERGFREVTGPLERQIIEKELNAVAGSPK